jgi:hypothetical protein
VRDFDFYEFVGILTPGATLVFGVALLQVVNLPFVRTTEPLSFGDLGATVVLSYVVGHLIQGVGNWFETLWWSVWRGWPTDWVRRNSRDDKVLSASQKTALEKQIRETWALSPEVSLSSLSHREWNGITRQIYGVVANAGQATRVDVFNANYGLLRGLTVAFLMLLVGTVLNGESGVPTVSMLLVASVLALFRMHRFAIHYARELFVRYLKVSG